MRMLECGEEHRVTNKTLSLLKYIRIDRDNDDQTRNNESEGDDGDQEYRTPAGGEFASDDPILCHNRQLDIPS